MGVNVIDASAAAPADALAAAPTATATNALTIAQRIAADATRIEYATDVAGRKIGVRKIGFLELFDLSRILGTDAGNESAMNMASAAMSVCSMDGEAIAVRTLPELRALMARLDFHGIMAATQALKAFEVPDVDVSAIKN